MIKSHICKVPSTYTCLECNMTCEEAKLGQTENAETSLRLLLFLLFCLILSFAGPELFFLARESCWEPLFWWSNSLWRWHCHHDSDSESVAHQQLIHEVDLQCGDDGGYMLSTGTKTTTFFCHKVFRWYFCIFTLLYFKGLKTFIGMWSLCECLIQVRDTWSEAPA